MTDELKVITIKMPASELDNLQTYLTDNDLDNRSEVIRKAIKLYIEDENARAEEEKNGVFVHLNPVFMSVFEKLVSSGLTNDAETYVRSLIEKDLIPEDIKADVKEKAFKDAMALFRN